MYHEGTIMFEAEMTLPGWWLCIESNKKERRPLGQFSNPALPMPEKNQQHVLVTSFPRPKLAGAWQVGDVPGLALTRFRV